MRNAKNVALVLCGLVVAGFLGYRMGELGARIKFENWKPVVVSNRQPTGLLLNRPQDADFSHFWTVWDKVSQMYVDKEKLDPKKMIDGAIAGMVAAIGDPYTAYFTVEQNKASKEELGGAFDGVGIQLGYVESQLAVMSPIDGSPAQRAGVLSGDLIIKIVDPLAKVEQETSGMTIPEAVKLIRGKKGTKVTLTLAREGKDKPFDVELERDVIVVKSVINEFVMTADERKVLWLKLTRFGDRTMEEWKEAVQLYSQNCDTDSNCAGVVLDLRNNPGGYLEGAVQIAGEFLPAGKLVVAQQYGDGRKFENKVNRNGALINTPLVVLVNKGSASASEILSGALQDHKRAKVVGVQSFGKGSVQQPEDFADGSGVHVTIARWLRPSGEWIDHKGITPDEEVKWEPAGKVETKDDLQLQRALELL